jgi:RND family efflux transporter MFP subunit
VDVLSYNNKWFIFSFFLINNYNKVNNMKTQNADLSSLKIDRSNNNSNSGNSKKTFYFLMTILMLIVVFAIGYWGWNKLFDPGIEVNLTSASLVSASQTDAILTASGYVVAQRKASVASKATGRLVYIGVVEGDAVKKDEVIGRLEDDDVKAQLDQAKASLKLYKADLLEAESNYKRTKGLFDAGVSSEKELTSTQAQYNRILAFIELSEAQIRSAEIAVDYTLIKAPFNGTVLTKNADVGEIVSPLGASSTSRAAIVTLADMSSLQVEADVSESNIEKIKQQQNCEITLDAYPGFRYAGYVDKIVPTADRSKATVLVKVAFKNYDSRVLPEMSAKVLFLNAPVDQSNLNKAPKLVVPKTAVVTRNSVSVIYKVVNNNAVEFIVTTGNDLGNLIEILSGISDGDKIIEKVTEKISDGSKVKVL